MLLPVVTGVASVYQRMYFVFQMPNRPNSWRWDVKRLSLGIGVLAYVVKVNEALTLSIEDERDAKFVFEDEDGVISFDALIPGCLKSDPSKNRQLTLVQLTKLYNNAKGLFRAILDIGSGCTLNMKWNEDGFLLSILLLLNGTMTKTRNSDKLESSISNNNIYEKITIQLKNGKAYFKERPLLLCPLSFVANSNTKQGGSVLSFSMHDMEATCRGIEISFVRRS